MFGLWLDMKKAAKSEQDLALRLAFAYSDCPAATSAWIMFFAGCLWRIDPTFFETLLYDFDGFIEGYDCKRILESIDCPVLFLRGDTKLGAVMTDNEISWLQENFSNVECIQIESVGHLLHLEDHGQTAVLAEMIAFLERRGDGSNAVGSFRHSG